MARLSLSLLGPFHASVGAEPLTDFRTRKVQALPAGRRMGQNWPQHLLI